MQRCTIQRSYYSSVVWLKLPSCGDAWVDGGRKPVLRPERWGSGNGGANLDNAQRARGRATGHLSLAAVALSVAA